MSKSLSNCTRVLAHVRSPLVVLASVLAVPAISQPAIETAEVDDIVITATKREQALQDVPLSVTAITPEALQRSGATGFVDFATKVPNLSFGYAGAGRQTGRLFQIRGIFGQDTSALYIGETPVPTSVDARVIDVERIEVLRGPQGSLFGARSMGGLIRIIPANPKLGETSARLMAGAGLVNEGGTNFRFDGTVNLPLSPKAALRLTAYYLEDAGFIDRLVDPDASLLIQRTVGAPVFESGDEFTRHDINQDQTMGLMATLRFEPTEALMLMPRVMYQVTESSGPPYVDNDVDNLVKVRQFDTTETGRDEWLLLSLEAGYDTGKGSIISSTSWFKRDTLDVEDGSRFIASRFGGRVRSRLVAPSVTSQVGQDERLTQELRFVSDFGGKWDLIVGGFYQSIERSSSYPPQSIIVGGSPMIGFFGIVEGDSFFSLYSTTKQKELGIFGEVAFKPVDQLTFTVGGRWFDVDTRQSRQDGGVLFTKLAGVSIPPFSGSQRESGFNPRFAVSWEAADEVTLYGNVAKGFRPGGVNDTAGACRAFGVDVPDSLLSDSLWNFEGGAKVNLAGGRFTTDLSAYHIKWKDRQTQTVDCGLGFGARDNVGEAISEGFELQMAVTPIEGVTLDGAVGYTNARITEVGNAIGVAVGDRLANVPKWNAAVALDVSQPIGDDLTAYGRIDFRYVGASISAQRNQRPAYNLVNARIGSKLGRFDISLFAQNLFDRRANLSDAPELSDSLNLIAIERPRTVGVDLRAAF